MKGGRLEVGDHVIIRQDLEPHTDEDANISFIVPMMEYLGRQAVITEKYTGTLAQDYYRYRLDINGWAWLEDWLIQVGETAEDEEPISCMDLL